MEELVEEIRTSLASTPNNLSNSKLKEAQKNDFRQITHFFTIL
jgi:hypothetical protein